MPDETLLSLKFKLVKYFNYFRSSCWENFTAYNVLTQFEYDQFNLK